MKKKTLLLSLLAVILPAILVFFPFFGNSSLAWGDAPFYWNGELSGVDLFSLWRYTGKSLGGVNMAFWLVPFECLVKFLDLIGISQLFLARAVFYLPALYLSFGTSYIFGKYSNLNHQSALLLSMLYVLNTYFLMIIDGGQVGIALAYSLFPASLLSLLNLNSTFNKASVFLAVLFSTVLMLADPRFLVLAALAAIILNLQNLLRYLPKLVLAFVPVVFLSTFWILPLLLSGGVGGLISQVSQPHNYMFLNGLAFYHPNWPHNLFGTSTLPSLIFWIFPVLVLLGFFKNISKQTLSMLFAYLFFAMLVNGNSYPLGFVYDWGLNNIPLASMFRDSTKFFAPAILFGGILVCRFAEPKKYLRYGVYVLIMLAILPNIFKFNFALSGRDQYENYLPITNLLRSEDEARVLWVPEKPPLAYANSSIQPVSASELSDYPIFSFFNTGTRNKFGYLEAGEVYPRLQDLGIKYIILSGNFRTVHLSEEEILEWQNLKISLNSNPYLEKIDLNTDIAVYKIRDPKEIVFQKDEIIIAQDYNSNTDAFLSDPDFDLSKISGSALANVEINATREEITLKLLQDEFQSLESVNSWAYYETDQRLEWQYQLLIRDLPLVGFDYGMGVSFSSWEGEEFSVDTVGKQKLAIRVAGTEDSILFIGNDQIKFVGEPKFNWHILDLPKNIGDLEIRNNQGLVIINTYVLLEEDVWQETLQKADQILEQSQKKANGSWVVYMDNYSSNWLYDDQEPVNILGGFNAYHIESEYESDKLIYAPQKYVKHGFVISGLSLALLVMIMLWQSPKSKN